MIRITYPAVIIFISLIWIIFRTISYLKRRKILWKREIQLLLVYICLIVISRFVFFPFSKVNGVIQPLIFDPARIYPFRINVYPLIHLADYAIRREAVLNLVGNITMFIPVGVIWPVVYKELNTHRKAIAAGVGFSLIIELIQLPFFDRVTDIDDLILNSLGYTIGYFMFVLIRFLIQKAKSS